MRKFYQKLFDGSASSGKPTQVIKKTILLTVLFAMFATLGFSQSDKFWSAHNGSGQITTDKAVARLAFPKEFKLFDLNTQTLRQELFTVAGNALRHTTVITLPNADGNLEKFEVVEASNFMPALQDRFPDIRAFSGTGITDPTASLKLSISPAGIQTMIFRAGKESEFIEAYSQDHKVYAVFHSQRAKGNLPWSCTTQDKVMFAGISSKIQDGGQGFTTSSLGQLKTMRLAQSCNGEYANFFGAFDASQVGLVLAAYNATLTRCNGVYEKDLALHLNLIPESVNVIYYDPATDPYSNNLGQWNGQLQATLTSVIGEDNYDIGHMFGASGGGGNAGCIGCVCNSGKGSGITSPADGIPQGDNFDIDYVVHEVGHQLGANHTFSNSNEGTGVNKEVGSGITIMGYAGITSQDVAPHSIDIFHEASIQQIQDNLATKTCPVTTVITANNATPVVAPFGNYIIPISTPFALTGSATDANAGDVLTYCWEQNDNGTGATTGANSKASPTKTVGPNFLSFSPTTNPTRTFPILATILAGGYTTGPLPGGDAGILIEALSSVARTLNFRLTVRDNSAYSSTAPVKVGQTAFTDMTITVNAAAGPFQVTVPNTSVSWAGNSSQTVTWDVNNTTAAPINCANVRILLSTDGGLTFPTVLAASTANDGTESVSIPNTPTTTARIKVESIGNIFFDISNTNFSITVPLSGYSFVTPAPVNVGCGAATTATATLATTSTGGYVVPIVLTATAGVPAGTTVSFGTNPVIPGNSTTVTLNNVNTLSAGTYNVTVTGVSGVSTQTVTVQFVVTPGTAPTLSTPAAQTVCAGSNASFTVTSSGTPTGYQWQVSTNGGTTYTNITGATAATYTITGVTAAMNNNLYRVIVTTQCSSATSTGALLTVQSAPAVTAQPQSATVCAGTNAVFNATATGAGLTYQWQVSTNGGTTFTDIAGATGSSLTITGVTAAMNGYQYHVVVTGTCSPAVTSANATLTVGDAASITTAPASQTVCVGSNASFSVTATGSSLTYQWQVSTDGGTTFTNIAGATTATYTITGATAAQNGNQYRVIVFSCTPTGITSSAATLTVNTPVTISSQPAATSVCIGGSASFSVTATGTGATYQWQYATSCTGTFTNIAGATTATYTITGATLANTGAYHVVITGACGAVTSSCALLTVNSPVAITSQPTDFAICLPATTATFTVGATGSGLTYQWQVSTDGGTTFTNIAGATGSTLTVTPLSAALNGNKYRAVLSGICTTSVTTNVVTLTVNTPVAITGQPTNASACSSDNAVFSVTATGSTITYQWQVSVNGGPFINLTNGSDYTGVNTNTLTVLNVNTGQNNNKYRVVVSGVPCGAVNSNTVTLTANARPSVVLALSSYGNITPGVRTGLYPTISPMGSYVYTWYKNDIQIPNFGDSYLPVSVDDFGSYKVTVTSTENGCSNTSNIVRLSDSASNMLFIYPNPTSGKFQVRYYNRGGGSQTRTLSIYDARGAKVFSKQFSLTGVYARMDVDLGNAGSGVYFVDLTDGSGNRLATGKVSVRR